MIKSVTSPGTFFRDHLDPKVSDWISPFMAGQPFDVALLGAPLSKTSISHSAAFRLPDAIRALFRTFTPFSVFHDLDLSEQLRAMDLGNVEMHLTNLTACLENIEAACFSYWEQHNQPLLLLGGDHSITGASILALAKAKRARYGILHFDAHHDVRNIEDGGRSNGTPFRTILDSGLVHGADVVQIGLKDFANAKAYYNYVRSHGVTVVSARETRQRGLRSVVEQAVEIASRDTDGVYVSFDMDVIDQSFVPGVPAPSTGGLTMWDSIDVVEWLATKQNVVAMDLVCVDPERDFRDLTVRATTMLAMSFLTGVALRSR